MSQVSVAGSWVEFSSVCQTTILCEFGLRRHQVLLQESRSEEFRFILAVREERPVLDAIHDGENNTLLKNIICRVFPPPDSPFSPDRTLHDPAIHLSRRRIRVRSGAGQWTATTRDPRSQHQISIKGFAGRRRVTAGRHSSPACKM